MQNEQQFVSRLYERLDTLREQAEATVLASFAQVGKGLQARVERDVTVTERTGLLSALNSVESGLCFGRIDFADGMSHHIGRIGIRQDDDAHTPLIVDWRAPVARPFYLATGHSPMGLRRRRHLTTSGRTVTALHDEVLDLADAVRTGYEDPRGDAVLLAALGAARTGRMADIVQTIQAEQDEIIRAPHRGVLVVEGGPGTGKTAVALHRAAYLLYAHREQLARRAVLIIGPNPAFLGYIGEVLPSLGETGVLLSTVDELFPGVRATGTDRAGAAAVKGRAGMADVLTRVLRDRQTVPDPFLVIRHERETLLLERAAAEDARHCARETRLPHNLARAHFGRFVLDALTAQLAERLGTDPYDGENLLDPDEVEQLGNELDANPEVHAAIDTFWPYLTPQQLISDFLADPVQLPDTDAALIRRTGGAWTASDIPLLDEAAELLGEDKRAARAAAARERGEQVAYAQGVLELSYGSRTFEFEGEESEILSAHDLIDAERFAERHEETDHRSAAERAAADRTWAFGHIIVDEAQELSAMAWRLLMRRCPTRSLTLVGDPAQTGDPAGCASWQQILDPYVGDRWSHVRLGVNYRTPAEIMEMAAGVARAADPSYEPPRSVRSTGVRPWIRATDDLVRTVAEAVSGETPDDGRLAVIAPRALHEALAGKLPGVTAGEEPDLTQPLVLLDARQAKGLEFDAVIVVEPALIVSGSARGASDLYVALTRATRSLGVVHTGELPEGLDQ
ncbi:AAA family ATPase [Streptomyces sp. H10-C2]|uniref:HelD family protein n=1 Tax=unclassified Streptomyces TaxID=2593676 RepID=UPI0024BBD566|nr:MULTISPECIES: AAA family ATPase [unclassified Streptomyces]MDJ0344088.1 AAA family ATPase [Streptomyces sp. PH10-H1]MDJ0368627.1 AAA family ATPase [Streptomyces sp. H10-C2]